MKLSRVAKFKEYRDSFTKEDAVQIDGIKPKDMMSTTNTLPYEKVMQEVQNQNEVDAIKKKEQFRRIVTISVIGFAALAITVGLVFLGILAFKR